MEAAEWPYCSRAGKEEKRAKCKVINGKGTLCVCVRVCCPSNLSMNSLLPGVFPIRARPPSDRLSDGAEGGRRAVGVN